MNEQIVAGSVIRTAKAHPCGGDEWIVIRIGADVKIRCRTCGRIVMLPRESFMRRCKSVISGAEPRE